MEAEPSPRGRIVWDEIGLPEACAALRAQGTPRNPTVVDRVELEGEAWLELTEVSVEVGDTEALAARGPVTTARRGAASSGRSSAAIALASDFLRLLRERAPAPCAHRALRARRGRDRSAGFW